MHTNVHCITIYNSQNMEATQMFIDRGMDEQIVVYMCVCVCLCVCVYIHIHMLQYVFEI